MRGRGAHLCVARRLRAPTLTARIAAGARLARAMCTVRAPRRRRVAALGGKVPPASLYWAPTSRVSKQAIKRLASAT
eukprot:7958713-Alexandrium_andersonii.AAC.1